MKYPDSWHTAQLRGRREGDLPRASDDDPQSRALYLFLSTMRARGRSEMEPGLHAELRRHGLRPFQDEQGRWRLPRIGKDKTMTSDDTLARLLNSHQKGDLPPRGNTGPWNLGQGPVDIDLGAFLKHLSLDGRVRPLAPSLVQALERHGLEPYEVEVDGNMKWKIPKFSVVGYSNSSHLLVGNQSHDGVPGPSGAAGPSSERETYSEMFGDITAEHLDAMASQYRYQYQASNSERETYSEMFSNINANHLEAMAGQYLDQVQYSHPMENPVGSGAYRYLPAGAQGHAMQPGEVSGKTQGLAHTAPAGYGRSGHGQQQRSGRPGPGRG